MALVDLTAFAIEERGGIGVLQQPQGLESLPRHGGQSRKVQQQVAFAGRYLRCCASEPLLMFGNGSLFEKF